MPKYIKKPIIIIAEQFDGSIESAKKIEQLNPSAVSIEKTDRIELYVYTMNGRTKVELYDWVLLDEETDDIWPCNSLMFARNYEEVG